MNKTIPIIHTVWSIHICVYYNTYRKYLTSIVYFYVDNLMFIRTFALYLIKRYSLNINNIFNIEFLLYVNLHIFLMILSVMLSKCRQRLYNKLINFQITTTIKKKTKGGRYNEIIVEIPGAVTKRKFLKIALVFVIILYCITQLCLFRDYIKMYHLVEE